MPIYSSPYYRDPHATPIFGKLPYEDLGVTNYDKCVHIHDSMCVDVSFRFLCEISIDPQVLRPNVPRMLFMMRNGLLHTEKAAPDGTLEQQTVVP